MGGPAGRCTSPAPPSSRPEGPRAWPEENKAGVRGHCQTGGVKTIAIKGTWERDRCAKLSPVRLSWDEGSRLPPQTPNPPGPGPAARHAKPWLGGRSLDALQIPGASTLGLGLRGRSGTRTAAAGRQGPPARSPAVTFPRAAWESAAPPAGCALSPSPPRADGRSRLSDPAPRRRPRPPAQAPPLPPAERRGAQLAQWGFRAGCGERAAAAAPAAASAAVARPPLPEPPVGQGALNCPGASPEQSMGNAL